jgi:cytochrome c-type biogenesis protein CcmH
MAMLTRAIAILGLCLTALTGPALAIEPSAMFDDPQKEQRARQLFEELRCVVCQNQSIYESNADVAADMREVIRNKINAGATNAEIRSYLTERYGDFVLLKPPMKPMTYALWFGPAVVVALGALGIGVYFRRRLRTKPTGARLSAAEERRLRELMNDNQGS